MQAVLHARVTRAQSMAKAFAKGGDRGQCAKNPLCVRGLDHGGRPGYCTLRGWALNEDDDEEEDGEDEPAVGARRARRAAARPWPTAATSAAATGGGSPDHGLS